MKQSFNFTTILILFLGVIVITGAVIWSQPAGQSFSDDGASFDTSSFDNYQRGEVSAVLTERSEPLPQGETLYQQLEVRLLTGDQAGQVITTEFTRVGNGSGFGRYSVGDKVVLGQLLPEQSDVLLFNDTEGEYVIVDRWRLPVLLFAVFAFVVLVALVGRMKGLRSLLGLVLTGSILILFTAPQLLAGKNAFLVTGVSAGIIATLGIFLAHGFKTRTKVAVLSTLLSLAVATGLSWALIYFVQLFGFGQSESFTLQAGYLGQVDLRGLLLGGLIISLLGVIDDVTTTQTATVAELHEANPELSHRELFLSAMRVGREHIASLVNTLILVYVGASLPLFLLLVAGFDQPVWTLLNSEFMAEEIIRALSGSAALILAVPIATGLAVLVYKKLIDIRD